MEVGRIDLKKKKNGPASPARQDLRPWGAGQGTAACLPLSSPRLLMRDPGKVTCPPGQLRYLNLSSSSVFGQGAGGSQDVASHPPLDTPKAMHSSETRGTRICVIT